MFKKETIQVPKLDEKGKPTKDKVEVLKYSAFDENGIPTKDHKGQEIIGKNRKFIEKEWEK